MARPLTLLQYGRVNAANYGPYTETGQSAVLVYTASGNLNGSEADGTNIRTSNETQFGTGYWGSQNASFTVGQTDPAGGTDGALLVEDTANNYHRCYQFASFTGTVAGSALVTFSVYAKMSSRRYLVLGLSDNGGNGFSANFDLQSGATGGVSASSGNGLFNTARVDPGTASYFKCSVKGYISTAPTGSTYLFVTASNSAATADAGYGYVGDGTSGVILWRPKLTQP